MSGVSFRMFGIVGILAGLILIVPARAQVIETVAGTGAKSFGGDGVPPTLSGLSYPSGIAFDATGRLLIADTENHRIRYVANNLIQTMIGTGVAGWSDSATLALEVPIHSPIDVLPLSNGSVVFSDAGNHRIRIMNPSGVVSTLVGDGTPAVAGDGQCGTQASVLQPVGLVTDATGNLFWAEEHRVRVLENNIVRTIAGTGVAGYAGDGSPPLEAQFNTISDLAVQPGGGIFVADTYNHRVRLISPGWTQVNAYAGNGIKGDTVAGVTATIAMLDTPVALTLDHLNQLIIANVGTRLLVRIRQDGLTARFFITENTEQPFVAAGLTRDSTGDTYYSQGYSYVTVYTGATGTPTPRELPFAGIGIASYGGEAVPAGLAFLATPSFIVVDPTGQLVFSDTGVNRVRQIDSSGIVRTIAGNGLASGSVSDGSLAIDIPVSSPIGLGYDATGNLYVAENGRHVIRRFTPEYNSLAYRAVGSGTQGYATGTTLTAYLNSPAGLAVGSTGVLVFADQMNHRVRSAEPSGSIADLAGNGTATYAGDLGPGILASLHTPTGVYRDSSGRTLIADTFNNRIRVLSPDGIITTLAGTGSAGYSGDSIPAVSAELKAPSHAIGDASGNIYIADTQNHRIRKISTDGKISTVAGTGTAGYNGDGDQAIFSQLNQPFGLLLNASGNLLIVDRGNGRIRKVDFAHLDPSLVNPPSNKSANAPGSVTLTVLDSGNGTVVPGRVKQGGQVRAEFRLFDKSASGAPVVVSAGWSRFAGTFVPDSLLVAGNPTPATVTENGIEFNVENRSLSDVSCVFEVGNAPSTAFALGTVVIVDATDHGADFRSITSYDPDNVFWTGAAEAGVVSTTLEIDNTAPAILSSQALVSRDNGSTYQPIVFPSLNSGDILLIHVFVQSDSLSELHHDLVQQFNSGTIRFENIIDGTSVVEAGSAGSSVFNATVSARVTATALPITPRKIHLTFADEVGNQTQTQIVELGVKTAGPSLITSDLIVNGHIAPVGTYRTGPDSGPNSMAEVSEGDEIQLVATFGSFNSTGLERLTADFSPIYPRDLWSSVSDLVPSVTSQAGSILTATWTVSTVDLGAGGISEVTFANLQSIGKTMIPLSPAGLPPGVTPTALPGVPGTPKLTVQAGALPSAATRIRISLLDADSAFPLIPLDTNEFTVDTQPPEAAVSLDSNPPFRIVQGALAGVPQRVRGGDMLTCRVEFTNPLILRNGNDYFAAGTSSQSITADLSGVGGPTASAVAPVIVYSTPQTGLPTIYTAQFDVTVSDQIGKTEVTSKQPVEYTFFLWDDVGNALSVISPATEIAVDNHPPTVSVGAVNVYLVSGTATRPDGSAIQIGQSIPTQSMLFPNTAVRITGTNIWDPIDDTLAFLARPDAMRVFFSDGVGGSYRLTDASSSSQNVFPTFVLTMPSAEQLRTTESFSIVIAASDALGNCYQGIPSPRFRVNGAPDMTLDVYGPSGNPLAQDAAGRTVTIPAGKNSRIHVSGFDLDRITEIGFDVSPPGRFDTQSAYGSLGTTNATGELSISPVLGDFLGPGYLIVSVTDSTGRSSADRITLLVNQPPVIRNITSSIYTGQTLSGTGEAMIDPPLISEDQRLILTIVGRDLNSENNLVLSATGAVFSLPSLATATVNGQSGIPPAGLPILVGPQRGPFSAVFELGPTFRTVSPLIGQVSREIQLTLSDGELSDTVSLPITVEHKPTLPQLRVSAMRLDGVPIPVNPTVRVSENSLLTVNLTGTDVSGEALTMTQTLGTGLGTFTATSGTDSTQGLFTFRPGPFDADLPEGYPPSLYDSPIDPSSFEFTTRNESGKAISTGFQVDIINTPQAPSLAVSATLSGRAIPPDSATRAVVTGQDVVIRAEAVDSDRDIVLIEFNAPVSAGIRQVYSGFGSATSELSLTFDKTFPVGCAVRIGVRARDQAFGSPWTYYNFQVVELSDRLSFLLPFRGVLTGTTGAAFVGASTEITIRETDYLDLIVRTSNLGPSETVTVLARGTALSDPRLVSAIFADQSIITGHSLPFVVSASGEVSTNFRLRPGLHAVPASATSQTATLELQMTDGILWQYHDLRVIIENVPTAPQLTLKDLRIDGAVIPVTQTIQIDERSLLTALVEVADTGAESVGLTASGLPPGAEFTASSGVPPVTGTLTCRPPLGAFTASPYSMVLHATNNGGFHAQMPLSVTVRQRYHPPNLQVGLTINEATTPITEPIALDTLAMLNLVFSGLDTDPDDRLILSVSGTVFTTTDLERVEFSGQSVQPGTPLPFRLEGPEPAGSLLLYPGVVANLPGQPAKEYTLELLLSDGVFEVSKTLTLSITATHAPPIVRLTAAYVDGISVPPSNSLTVSEGHVLTGTVIAFDPTGLPLAFSVREAKGLAQIQSCTSVGFATSEFRIAPGPIQSASSPLAILFTARNQRSETTEWTLNIDILDVDFPAQAAMEVYVDGRLQSAANIYSVTAGHGATAIGYAWDPDEQSVLLNVANSPPGSVFQPPLGLDTKLGAQPAIVSVTFVPQTAGEILSVTFIAGDSLSDILLGDTAIGAQFLILSASVPPTLQLEVTVPNPIWLGQSVNLVAFVDDPEGDPVTLLAYFDGNPVVQGRDGFSLLNGFYTPGTVGGILIFQPGHAQLGNHVLTIEATDGQASTRRDIPLSIQAPVGTPTPSPTPTPTAVPDTMLLSQGHGGTGTSKRQHRIGDVWRQVPFSGFQGLTRATAAKLNTSRERAVNTAVADIDGDGVKDIVVGFGPGGVGSSQPSILVVWRTFGGLSGGPKWMTSKGVFSPISSNEKYRNPHGALNVAAGNFAGYGLPMIAAAQGLGGSHQIRILQYTPNPPPNGKLETLGTIRGLHEEALWGNGSGGVAVAAGDVNQDGLDELVVGQMNGEGATTLFQALLLKWDVETGQVVLAGYTPPAEAFPIEQHGLGGVNLAVGDVDEDGQNEIIAATAGYTDEGAKNFLRVFRAELNPDGSIREIVPITQPVQVFGAVQNPSGGIDIAAGNLDSDWADELLIGTQAILNLNLETGGVTFDCVPPRDLVKGINFHFDENGEFTGISEARSPFVAYDGVNLPTSGAVNVEFYPAE
ncbi:MAG TPA: hypothetical protein PLQ35_04355 [bacterium]|nr:hypothetical protein [bacterium]